MMALTSHIPPTLKRLGAPASSIGSFALSVPAFRGLSRPPAPVTEFLGKKAGSSPLEAPASVRNAYAFDSDAYAFALEAYGFASDAYGFASEAYGFGSEAYGFAPETDAFGSEAYAFDSDAYAFAPEGYASGPDAGASGAVSGDATLSDRRSDPLGSPFTPTLYPCPLRLLGMGPTPKASRCAGMRRA